ncbi:MAG: MBOAT family O-acyltransferase [Planctomycetota bacterium]
MLFYTDEFFIFSLILVGVLAVVTRHAPRKLVLLTASYAFYMWWNPAFILLILFSTAVDFLLGRHIEQTASRRRRTAALVASLVSNLGLLAWFKYADFFGSGMFAGLRLAGCDVHWTALNVTLPVGISFYTFQTLSYTIDVYRGRLSACRNPLDFALFVAFFPQLIAGPIVRAGDFLPQLQHPAPLCFDRRAAFLFLRGLVKKVLIANNVAVLVDRVMSDVYAWPSWMIWLGAIGFSVQIYCDFSGYSDMAIALGRMLGYRLPRNFDRPYLARSPGEFWQRWHISLSTWLRDYLYIPLGGNRHGRWLTLRNLMVTMLLGGLWHGASWNFLLWGFLHGLALGVHRVWTWVRPEKSEQSTRAWRLLTASLSWAATQYWVLLTWLCFRLQDPQAMLHAMKKFVLFDFDYAIVLNAHQLRVMGFALIVSILVAFFLFHFLPRRRSWDETLARMPLWLSCPGCVLMGMSLYFLWPQRDLPFVYFQF